MKRLSWKAVTIIMTTSVLCLSAFSYNASQDQTNSKSKGENEDASYNLSPEVKKYYEQITANDQVKQGLDFIKADHEQTVSEQIDITEIPAPPFKEQLRAEDYKKRLEEVGLKDVQMDEEGNVFGIRQGTGDGPVLFVSAHLDTVFPEGTDTKVIEKDGILYAPGISDDGRGLAALLSIVRAFNESGIQTKGDIIFGGTVGEEGLGDLRGVKAFFKEHPEVDGYISLDGTSATGITYKATGSHRYKISYKGPGGHSFGAFGTPSAIHALGRAISDISNVKTVKNPKTTFTVGTVEGGTSVNAIAAEANMLVDMRSNDEKELIELENKILRIAKNAAKAENKRWKFNEEKGIKAEIELLGDRPAGTQPDDALNVQAAWASTQAINLSPALNEASSTDANLPISLGIPSLVLGGGGKSGLAHSPDEWFDPTDAYQGPQRAFLTMLGLVGVDGISEPLLPEYKSTTN